MILSMTGFAAVADELPGVAIAVELRSVNHRYLDLTLKLPEELRTLESILRERIASELKRGKVECRVAMNRRESASVSDHVDASRVIALVRAAASVRAMAPDAPPLSVADILRWPGVMADTSADANEAAARVPRLVDRALAEMAAARLREGEKLKALLLTRCNEIERQVARVVPRIPAIHAAYVEKMTARLREAGLEPGEERIKQELALFATKTDVAEELERLTAHITEVRRILAAGGTVGKRLDFLAQELNREGNTLASKSTDADLSKAALEIKVAVEQMREQVQNIE